MYPAISNTTGAMARLPSADAFSAQQSHYQQQQQQHNSPPNISAAAVTTAASQQGPVDNREWCSLSYRPARSHTSENRRYYPYSIPTRTQASSPPYATTQHPHTVSQAAHPGSYEYPPTSFVPGLAGHPHMRGGTSMPELTPLAVVRPDTVASSGPLPFDKEQVLAQSSSRSSFLTPPNSAPPCHGGSPDEQGTPTSSHPSILSHAVTNPDGSAVHNGSAAASASPQQGRSQTAAGGYGSHDAASSDNDSGHGDSPYATVMRHSQSHLLDNPDSPEDSHSGDGGDGDAETTDIGPGEFMIDGKKLLLSDEFARVPGRLSLLGAASKYVVTVGEIKRRLSPPECLNASLLGGVLRKAKAKNGGSDLRNALDNIGVALPPGRRKATSTSMLTSLVEEESKALACQFNEVCATMFPVAEMANTVAQQHEYHQRGAVYREHRQQDIHSALNLTNELRELLDAYIVIEEENQNKENDRLPMTGLRQFSLITHSFGIPTISGVLSLFQSYLTTLLKCTGGIPVRDDHALHRGQMR